MSFSPSRLALDFSVAGQDLPDEFYESHFNTLFGNVYSLVQGAFCPSNKAQAPKVSPWVREYSKEFLTYVQLVAHPDARAGKWERLLSDKAERACLLTAVIFKVLDTNVFSHLLFGASSEHEALLRSSDAALIDAEGVLHDCDTALIKHQADISHRISTHQTSGSHQQGVSQRRDSTFLLE